MVLYLCRRHDFHPSYGRIHKLRAFVPKVTLFMACTATITQNIRREVIQDLEMINCEFVCTSPDIYYEVLPHTNIDAVLKFIVNSLKKQTVKAPRVIAYCHSLDICANLYAHFHHELGENSYYPPESVCV